MRELRAWLTGLLVFAILLVGVLGVAWAIGAQYESSPNRTVMVTDETVTANVSNWSDTDAPEYALEFYDNETVTNSSGAVLEEGVDYEWDNASGELYWYNTTSVSDGEQMQVDYAYRTKQERVRRAMAVLSPLVEVILPIGVLIVAAMSVAGLAAGIYALFGGRGSPTYTRR